ncbi:MAG: hypothetical protein AB7F19_07805 [Candidatus Babeliales bacterium]
MRGYPRDENPYKRYPSAEQEERIDTCLKMKRLAGTALESFKKFKNDYKTALDFYNQHAAFKKPAMLDATLQDIDNNLSDLGGSLHDDIRLLDIYLAEQLDIKNAYEDLEEGVL